MVRSISPAIVIMAHNRPDELRQLLASVGRADVAAGTPLVLSLDLGGDRSADVAAIADAVSWPHGTIRRLDHDRIGLVEHFHRCGDLADDFGAIVLLEDDLLVGPAFHRWATSALQHASDDAPVAGVSLASPFFDGYRHLPFEPILDGYDGVFAQIPWYDGMAWTSDMWQGYRNAVIDPTTPIHRSFLDLADDEWFPDATRFLVQSERYYLLPRNAHATNSGAAGTHFGQRTDYFQVPLSMRGSTEWRLVSLDDSLAVYDDHLEPTPSVVRRLVPDLTECDFAVDLLGVRDLSTVSAEHVLTTRPVDGPVRSWGASLHPLVANLVHDVQGNAIHLAATARVHTDAAAGQRSFQTLNRHAQRGRAPSGRETLHQLGSVVRERFRGS